MARSQDERSLGELVAELSRETGVLVRKEVELATTEMTAKVRTAAAHVGTIAAGGALAHAGLLVLLAAFVIGLAQLGVAPWLSALIVALATMGIGYALVSKGRANLSRASLAPTQTIETLKETATWQTRTPA
jgi:Putative Actinobacterial Holin-X, holin superfamily III